MAQIIDDIKLDFQDVLILPKRSTLDSRSKVNLERTYTFKHSRMTYVGIPVLAANMDTVGTMSMAAAFQQYQLGVALHKFYTEEQLIAYFTGQFNPHTFYSMGITSTDYWKFTTVMEKLPEENKLKYVCIDVANGYSRKFVDFVSKVREDYPNLTIMAGNVVTGDMVYDLLERGADIVKVGIGSGSVCTTRKVTGVGYPQLSAVMECQDAAHGADGHICSDGGVTCPGDLAKAFAAGADFVMCGGILAGHTECEGELIYDVDCYLTTPTTKIGFKDPNAIPSGMRFYGMSSQQAMDNHYGGKATYRAAEGKVVEVPYKGNVSNTIEEYLGGLRSTCTYCGARRLKDLSKCTTFIKVHHQLNNSLNMYNV